MTLAPNITPDDVAAAWENLLPQGYAWPRDPASVQAQDIASLAPLYATLAQRDANLLVDAFPATAIELLTDWEASLGLPDPCTPLGATIQQRQRAVVAKLIGRGGQSIAYFVAVAAALGYSITVTEYAPFRTNINATNSALYAEEWANTWTVNVAPTETIYFQTNASVTSAPLIDYVGTAELVCRLTAIAPAHTRLLFNFT